MIAWYTTTLALHVACQLQKCWHSGYCLYTFFHADFRWCVLYFSGWLVDHPWRWLSFLISQDIIQFKPYTECFGRHTPVPLTHAKVSTDSQSNKYFICGQWQSFIMQIHYTRDYYKKCKISGNKGVTDVEKRGRQWNPSDPAVPRQTGESLLIPSKLFT